MTNRLFGPPVLMDALDHGPAAEGWTALEAVDALGSDDPRERAAAVQALATLAESDAPLWAHVRRALEDKTLIVRAGAAIALGLAGDKSGAHVLAEAVDERDLRYPALEALRRAGAQECRAQVETVFHSWLMGAFERLQAAAALAAWGDAQAARYVEGRASKRRALDRGLALELCADLRLTGAFEACLAALAEGKKSIVRSTAVLALGRLGDSRAVDPLAAIHQDDTEDSEVREDAAEALSALERR